jgi:hypothetical protein
VYGGDVIWVSVDVQPVPKSHAVMTQLSVYISSFSLHPVTLSIAITYTTILSTSHNINSHAGMAMETSCCDFWAGCGGGSGLVQEIRAGPAVLPSRALPYDTRRDESLGFGYHGGSYCYW